MMEGYPYLKEEVGGSIPGCKVSSLLDKNLSSGQLPPMLWRWHVDLLSQKKEKKREEKVSMPHSVLDYLKRTPLFEGCMVKVWI